MDLQMTFIFFILIFFLNVLVPMVEYTMPTNNQNAILPRVTIPQGTLQGITLLSRYSRSISAFLGIPYAQPPIGKLRFSSPVPADAWNGTLDASREGSSCPQLRIVGDEDCLYLNVYTPKLTEANNATLLPVMVFIHGGAFEEGNGNSHFYGPGYLLDADLILVSINYRLGPLGFLSTGDEVAPGNWGFKDQVLALRWVQNNIAHFGGNPDQVTIFGQSAGGVSVELLALSDLAIGLFHKYISQSGSAYCHLVHQPRSSYANHALQLGEFLGCPTNTSSLLIDCLRELWGLTDEPDIEGAFLTDSPANLLAAGKIHDLPSMAGTLRDDGGLFVPGTFPESETFEEFTEKFDNLLPLVLQYPSRGNNVTSHTAALKKFYFNNDLRSNRTQTWFNYVKLLTDSWFAYPAYRAAQKQLNLTTNPLYFYSYEYLGSYNYGNRIGFSTALNKCVVHTDELYHLFPTVESWQGRTTETFNETDLKISETLVQLWTNFAINGTPTTSAMNGNTIWRPYSSDGEYLRIGNGADATVDLRNNFLQERMQFWDNLTSY